MIITRTPFRVSFFGGGSDMPWFYEHHPSLVVGAAINKYCFISLRKLPKYFKYKSRISYSKIEEVCENEEIEHKAIRESLRLYGIEDGVEISHSSDVPARTGIGSSSSFAVGLINAIRTINYKAVTKQSLASEAIYLEQKVLCENVGCQDQIFASYGGLNIIRFSNKFNSGYSVTPLFLEENFEKKLFDSIILIFSETDRISSSVSGKYLTPISNKENELLSIVQMAEESISLFQSQNIEKIGKLLHKSWEIKRNMHEAVSNNKINNIYNDCMSLGAYGGKLLGAGGGGFLMIMANKIAMSKIKETFKYSVQIPIEVDYEGSKLLYHNR